MRTDSYITLWHLDENTGEYDRKIYRALCHFDSRLSKSGIKQKGYFSGDRAVVRVPASEKPQVCLGDFVRPGRWQDDVPKRIDDLKVTQVTENFKGANPHLRLFLGRSSERS